MIILLVLLCMQCFVSAQDIDRTFFYHRTARHDLLVWYLPTKTTPLISYHLHEQTAEVRITVPRATLSTIAQQKFYGLIGDLTGCHASITTNDATDITFVYNPRRYAISVYNDIALGRFPCVFIAIERLSEKHRSSEKKLSTIVIDPGHGGFDSGAVSQNGTLEKEIALTVAQQLEQELKRLNYTVYLTRQSDTFVELDRRTAMVNGLGVPALFVSIHANGSTDKKKNGFELYYPSFANSNQLFPDVQSTFLKQECMRSAVSDLLAQQIQQHLKKVIGDEIPDRGRFGTMSQVLSGSQVPAVLVELGYLSNPTEASKLLDTEMQSKQAMAIAQGIDAFARQIKR